MRWPRCASGREKGKRLDHVVTSFRAASTRLSPLVEASRNRGASATEPLAHGFRRYSADDCRFGGTHAFHGNEKKGFSIQGRELRQSELDTPAGFTCQSGLEW